MTVRDAQLGWGGASSVYRRLTVSVSRWVTVSRFAA
jgi:hypothetical protein